MNNGSIENLEYSFKETMDRQINDLKSAPNETMINIGQEISVYLNRYLRDNAVKLITINWIKEETKGRFKIIVGREKSETNTHDEILQTDK